MNLETKLKNLDKARAKLNEAAEIVYDAGKLYEEVFEVVPTKVNRFYNVRLAIQDAIEHIDYKANELRNQKTKEENFDDKDRGEDGRV